MESPREYLENLLSPVGLVGPIIMWLSPRSSYLRAEGWYRSYRTKRAVDAAGKLIPLDDSVKHNIAFGVEEDQIDEDALQAAVRAAELEEVIAEMPQRLDEGRVVASGSYQEIVEAL